MTSFHRASGPSRIRLLRDLPGVRRNMPAYMVDLANEFGETVYIPIRYPTYILRNPEDVKYILVNNPKNYHKAGSLKVGKELFGNGLVSGEPPLHTQQRRIMQPMFHRQSISRLGESVVDDALKHISGWQNGAVIDLAEEMMALTLTIVGKVLFSVDLHRDAREIGNAFLTAERLVVRRMLSVPIPLWVPTPSNTLYRKVIAQIDHFVFQLISNRRKTEDQPGDLLSMLMGARFEDGTAMSDQQMRDELVTLLAAGHETVANTFDWTWHLLSHHPEVEQKLIEEWQRVLGGRNPTMEDIPALTYTDLVLTESMRLYPPAWILARRAIGPDQLPSGLEVRIGDELMLSPYVQHRHPGYFTDPDSFIPERWTPEFRKSLPGGVYFPFGMGTRYCIGEQLAKMELMMVLPTIGQKIKLIEVPGQAVQPEALITMRPKDGLKMEVSYRA